jgi:hypothetical protein
VNVLLKIVQGPNAGAEIVLAEGMTVSLGKGDSCDILRADQSLADVACELEVNAERVRMLLPGGAEERLEPFRVKFLGETTALAVGPETGAWDELVWPARGVVPASGPDGGEEPVPSSAEPARPERDAASAGKEKGCGCAAALALVVPVAAALSVFLLWPFRSAISNLLGPVSCRVRPVAYAVHDAGCGACGFACDFVKGFFPSGDDCEVRVQPPPGIRDVASKYGLSCSETDGACVLSGNFATRARRLSATAEAYAARPGVSLDLSDDESLRSATAEVLELVSEGRLKVHSATNRMLALSGFAPGASSLRTALEAIRADVPHVRDVDCTRVRLGETTGMAEVPGFGGDAPAKRPANGVKTARVRRDGRKGAAPKMPVVGVLTVPYPCLVLKDGSRVTEGAEFGGFVIDRIGADTIRIKGPEGTFEWKP